MSNQKVSKGTSKDSESKKNKVAKNKFAQKRERRYFSEDFRKARVKEIEKGSATVSEISKLYDVSGASIYKWLRKYSIGYRKMIVKIVEPKSITKKLKMKEENIVDLKQLVAEQQVELVYYKKLFEIIEDHYGEDFKKNMDLNRLSSLETIKNSLKKKE